MGLKVHMPEVMKTRTEMELDRLRKTEREKMNIFCARGKVSAMRDSIERSGEGEDKSDGGR